MSMQMLTPLASWLMTVALHGSLFLAVAWVMDRIDLEHGRVVRTRRAPRAWKELMWRCALFGGVISASLQVIAGTSPFAEQWHLGSAAQTIDSVSTKPIAAPRASPETSSITNSESSSASIPAGRSVVSSQLGSSRVDSANLAQSSTTAGALNWPAWICSIWLVGVLIALTRLLRGLARLHGALREAVALPAAGSDLVLLAQDAEVREPRLYCLADIASPMAVSPDRIIIPAWAIEMLDRRQLRAMLAHELAHIARHDPDWKLLTGFWRAVFWFLPLAWVAQRRLEDLAELACDAFATRHTGNARLVAECLAACAEHHMHGSGYALASAMALRESSLMHRIECLLEGVCMDTFVPSLRARGIAIIVLTACALSLPAITFLQPAIAQAAQLDQSKPDQPKLDQSKPDQPKQDSSQQDKAVGKHNASHSSVSIQDDGDTQVMSVSQSDADHAFSANVIGKITFSADETNVASLSAGGTASFEESFAGVTHRLELAERRGQLERRYFVDQHEQPFDAAGSAWFAHLLPALIRETGIGAEARVQRLYTEGGAPRVLDEIDQVHSSYVRDVYLGLLLDRGRLAAAELDHALKLAGAMDSDYEHRQALSRIFVSQALSESQQVTFLQQAMHFDSDYERAELLIEVVPKLVDSANVRQAWLDAALGVSSDYERRRALQSMLTRDGLDDSQLARVIDASASMSSDYEHRELLVAVAKRARNIDVIAPAYAHATQTLSSDYERREALLALINTGKLSARSAGAVLDSAANIGSDFECREVLVALAHDMPNDTALVERYRQLAERLSEYERGQAEHALLAR